MAAVSAIIGARKEFIDENCFVVFRRWQRWGQITAKEQQEMLKSAEAGIRTIIRIEPKITEDGADKLTISGWGKEERGEKTG